MKKRTKVIFVILSFVIIVSVLFVNVSAASAPTNLFTNVYCPTVYGSYNVAADGLNYTRSTGGYASNNRFLENSRSTMYMTTQYIDDSRGPFSLFSDGVYMRTFGSDEPASVYYGTDSIVYGISTIRGSTSSFSGSENYIYFPCYNLKDFGFCYYTTYGPVSDYSTILGYLPKDTYDIGFMFTFVVNYLDDNFERHSIQYSYTRASSCPFVNAFDFQSFASLCSNYIDGWNDNYRFISVGMSSHIDGPLSYRYYNNFIFAIGNAAEYINEGQYLQDIKSIGYDEGFSDGGNFDNFGVLSFIGDSIGGVLGIEIFDGFAIGHLVLVAIVVPLFVWILKVFGGG